MRGFLLIRFPFPAGPVQNPFPLTGEGRDGGENGFAASFRTLPAPLVSPPWFPAFAGMTEFHKDLLNGGGFYRFGEGFVKASAGRGDNCCSGELSYRSQNRDRYSSSSKAPARLRIVQYAWSARCTIVFSRLRSTFSPSAECAPAVCTMASGRPTVSATCTP